MLNHLVTFTFKDSTAEADIIAFHAAMNTMLGEIPQVRSSRSGSDLGLRPNNADYGEVVEFTATDDFHTYLQHAAHKAFLEEFVIPMCESWSAIQFLTN